MEVNRSPRAFSHFLNSEIQTPPRTGGGQSVLLALCLVLMPWTVIFPSVPVLWAVLFGGFAALAWLSGWVFAVHVAILFALGAVIKAAGGVADYWFVNKIAPLVLYFICVALVPSLRGSLFWLRMGRLSRSIVLMVVATALLAAAGLAGWVLLCKPELEKYVALLPELPPWAMGVAGLLFAVVNAGVEESVYRGVITQGLENLLGPGWSVILLQALLFGWAHNTESGFPNGAAGVVLAGLFGIMLGYLRKRSRGMLAPWLPMREPTPRFLSLWPPGRYRVHSVNLVTLLGPVSLNSIGVSVY